MTAEDRESDDRIAAAVRVSLRTIEHSVKRIEENRTGVAHKEAVVNPCSSKELKAEIRLCETK